MKCDLKKVNEIENILDSHMFECKHTIDDWTNCYYSDTFDGHIEHDIEDDEIRIYKNNTVLIELANENLNGFTLEQYLIEFVGK